MRSWGVRERLTCVIMAAAVLAGIARAQVQVIGPSGTYSNPLTITKPGPITLASPWQGPPGTYQVQFPTAVTAVQTANSLTFTWTGSGPGPGPTPPEPTPPGPAPVPKTPDWIPPGPKPPPPTPTPLKSSMPMAVGPYQWRALDSVEGFEDRPGAKDCHVYGRMVDGVFLVKSWKYVD